MVFSGKGGRWARIVALALVTGVAGCGGGGGGGASRTNEPAYVGLAGICTPEAEKRFVRSYMDEVYLWFDEIPAVDAGVFSKVIDYFEALLVVTPDANGLPKDQFSGVVSTARADMFSVRPIATDLSQLRMSQSTELLAATVGSTVPLDSVITTTSGVRTGYVRFDDQAIGAQDALIESIKRMKTAGVTELVLDMRNNEGGFLYVARSAASMITGPQNNGRIFEQLRFNSKRTELSQSNVFRFSDRVEVAEAMSPVGTPLPQLNLSRLYVLTTGATCSASESIINSLRGIGVPVVLIGDTTCGKPYGFRRKDNCGLAYFPIEFQGYNEAGFGDYSAGFAPTCAVVDTTMGDRVGDRTEPLLAAALRHIETGSCPP